MACAHWVYGREPASPLKTDREHMSTFFALADYHACRDVDSLIETFLLRTVVSLTRKRRSYG